jgi:protein required for attachment to host cells
MCGRDPLTTITSSQAEEVNMEKNREKGPESRPEMKPTSDRLEQTKRDLGRIAIDEANKKR